jgi:copper(I)-binding protein
MLLASAKTRFMNIRRSIALSATLLLAACGQSMTVSTAPVKIAQINAQAGNLVIGDAWARATAITAASGNDHSQHDANATGMNSAAYMIIQNNGDADKLVSVTGDVAKSVGLHVTTMKDGVMSMNPLPDGADVPAGGSLVLKPAGYHIMLIGVKQNLEAGGTFKLTLKFKSGTAMTIDVPVRAP